MALYNITAFDDDSTERDDLNNGQDLMNIIVQSICSIREDFVKRLIIFVLFIAFGVVGNVTLLIVILKDRHLRNPPNILICNLAIADLLYILVTGPISFEHEIHPCWFSGRIPCAIKNFAPLVCKCACVYSLVALSRERYSAIVKGMHSLQSRTKLISLCWAILGWVLGLIVASPILTTDFSTVKHLFNIPVSCQAVTRGSKRAKVFEICAFLIFYLIPLIFIVIHYTKMSHFLIVSTSKFKQKDDSFKKQTKARKRLAYMAIIITIFFCVFSLPSYVSTFMFHFAPENEFQGEAVTKFRHSCYFMSLANSSLNPWLVFVISSAHRERLKRCLLCRVCRKPSRNGSVTSPDTSLRMISNVRQSIKSNTRITACYEDTHTKNGSNRNESLNKPGTEHQVDIVVNCERQSLRQKTPELVKEEYHVSKSVTVMVKSDIVTF